MIAVVVYGLYGSATGRWHMSPRIVESGTFDTFWDTVAFCFNGLVFFFAGASATNFFWRSSQARAPAGAQHSQDLALVLVQMSGTSAVGPLPSARPQALKS